MDDDVLRDLFDGLGPIGIRRMFGGKAVSAAGLTVALEAAQLAGPPHAQRVAS